MINQAANKQLEIRLDKIFEEALTCSASCSPSMSQIYLRTGAGVHPSEQLGCRTCSPPEAASKIALEMPGCSQLLASCSRFEQELVAEIQSAYGEQGAARTAA